MHIDSEVNGEGLYFKIKKAFFFLKASCNPKKKKLKLNKEENKLVNSKNEK